MEDKKQELESRLTVFTDDFLPNTQKDKVLKSLSKMLNSLRQKDSNLDAEIEESQEKVTAQIRPIYVFIAIFGIFLLFLGGQESIHSFFPRLELYTLLLLTSLTTAFLYSLSFTKYHVSVLLTGIIALIVVFISLLFPLSLFNEIFPDKLLVNIALILSFLPFALAITRLFTINLILNIKYRFPFFKAKWKISRLEKNLEKLKSSRDFIDEF